MRHPFEFISAQWRRQLFWMSLVASLALMVLLNLVGAPLITAPAPQGIISYEFAGSLTQARAILDSWGPSAQLHAAFSLGLDYVFMLAYSAAIGLGCLWAADILRMRSWPLVTVGLPLAWGQWLAVALDAIENVALTALLFGSLQSPWPEIARWCATFKFALVFVGLIYTFLGLAVSLVARLAPKG